MSRRRGPRRVRPEPEGANVVYPQYRILFRAGGVMNVTVRARNILRGMKQRWGTSSTKRRLWDSEYASGKWDNLYQTTRGYFYDSLEGYCRNGSILDLGCGSGSTGNELRIDCYGEYVGVDVSEVAVRKASERSLQNGRDRKNRYVAEDILTYVPQHNHDVILFRESIYYIPRPKIKALLLRYSQFLKSDGVFMATITERGTKRSKKMKIRRIIDENFKVLEKLGPDDAVVIFRARS
jgi:SAM-dependent methyltransferase